MNMWTIFYLFIFRPQLHAVKPDMLVRRHILPATSTPVGAHVRPMLALNRGATFSVYDSNLRCSATGQINVADVINGCQSNDDSRRILRHDSTSANGSEIQFSPDKHQCSTPAGRGRCAATATASFLVRRELASDSSFGNKSHCSTRVNRHASLNCTSVTCSDDRPRKPEKLSGSFLSGGGLGFLRKLSRGSAHSSSPNNSSNADVSTTSVRRRTSLRDSFKRIFLNRRFSCYIIVTLFCALNVLFPEAIYMCF